MKLLYEPDSERPIISSSEVDSEDKREVRSTLAVSQEAK